MIFLKNIIVGLGAICVVGVAFSGGTASGKGVSFPVEAARYGAAWETSVDYVTKTSFYTTQIPTYEAMQCKIQSEALLEINTQEPPTIYYEGTFNQALNLAKRTNRYLIVEFYAKWSHQSRWNNQKTMANPAVQAQLNNRFVVLKADVQTDQGATLALDYQVTTYPNMVIFDPWGNAVIRIDQNLEPADFIALLDQTTSRGNIDRATTTVRQILISAQKYGPHDAAIEEITTAYLANLPIIEALNSTNWALMDNPLTMYYNSPCYNYLLKNRSAAAIIAGESKIENALLTAVKPTIIAQAIGSQPADSTVIAQIQALQINSITPWITLAKARQNQDLDTYMWQIEQTIDLTNISDHDFSLILSLELVANNPQASKTQKHRAIKIATAAIRATISPSQISLLDKLITRLKG